MSLTYSYTASQHLKPLIISKKTDIDYIFDYYSESGCYQLTSYLIEVLFDDYKRSFFSSDICMKKYVKGTFLFLKTLC